MADRIHTEQLDIWDRMAARYDELVTTQELGADVEAVASMLPKHRAAILELGAGTGRVAIPLSELGHDITAVDLSEKMLEELRGKDTSGRICTMCQDMRRVRLEPGAFDVVLCLFNTFCYATSVAAQREVLRSVRHHLAPGGFAVIQNTSPGQLIREWGAGPKVIPTVIAGGLSGTMAGILRTDEQRLAIVHTFTEGDRLSRYETYERYVWASELSLMAELEGLRVTSLHGDWNLSAYRHNSQYLIARLEHGQSRSPEGWAP